MGGDRKEALSASRESLWCVAVAGGSEGDQGNQSDEGDKGNQGNK